MSRSMSLSHGVRLGPYEIIGALASGGMGEVYRARDTRLGRDVALKIIRSGERSAEYQARFEREARAVAALNHPNIMALYDIGTESGMVYAVMELLEGATLRDRLRRAGRFTPAKAFDVAIQIARGLAAAHERGIVHRDLKPENVFITNEGRVKILDFGLAEQVTTESGEEALATQFVTRSGIVMGTPAYMSPEQMLGEAATARSDLFAFGVVVHEMLTGSHPFGRAANTEMAAAILRDDPQPLSPAVQGLPPAAVMILARCLDKHATDRPESARDVALYLEAIGTAHEHADESGAAAINRRRLRSLLLALSCGLAIVLSAVMWGLVGVTARRTTSGVADAELARADAVVRRVERDRLTSLSLVARLVASFPELKALLATDEATVRDFLVAYQQRNPAAPLLAALGRDGKVIARTDDRPGESGDASWAADVLGGSGEPTIVHVGGRPYALAVAVAEAGGSVFGYVVAAMPVDAAFAAALREATQDEVVLLSDTAVLASTLRSEQTPWRSHRDWRSAGGREDRAIDVGIGAQRFAAREVKLADQPPVAAVLLRSQDEAVDPFRRIQYGIALVGLLGAAAAAIASVWIARTIGAAQR